MNSDDEKVRNLFSEQSRQRRYIATYIFTCQKEHRMVGNDDKHPLTFRADDVEAIIRTLRVGKSCILVGVDGVGVEAAWTEEKEVRIGGLGVIMAEAPL